MEKDHSLIIAPDDDIFSDGQLKINTNILPLHPNYRLIYETVMQLNPGSVLEIGCGGGDHLHNLSILNPDIKLFGRDISGKQIKWLHQRHKELKADVRVQDITKPQRINSPFVDLVFTQAVIMHIKTNNNHLIALENIFQLAKNQVILMENWSMHNFLDDITCLYEEKKIPWDNLYPYYRISEEYQKPHLMILSRIPLDYPSLDNYNIFLE